MSDDANAVFTITDAQFKAGVADAAQLVAQVHRRRLVKHGLIAGLIAGFVASAAVALPLVYFSGRSNCNAITKLAKAAEHRFVESRKANKLFLSLSKDRLGLTDSQFTNLTRKNEAAQGAEIEATRSIARRDCALV